MSRVLAAITFGVFLSVTLFGLLVLLSHADHHSGCPLAAQAVLCESTIIEHFSIWQSMLASVVAALVLLLGFSLFVTVHGLVPLPAHERLRIRLVACVSRRPTLLQELFSQGILNRKEPYPFPRPLFR